MQKLLQLQNGSLFVEKGNVTYLSNEQLKKTERVHNADTKQWEQKRDLAMAALDKQIPIEAEISAGFYEALNAANSGADSAANSDSGKKPKKVKAPKKGTEETPNPEPK